MKTSVRENLKYVLAELRDAEQAAGRAAHSVKLLAVSKFHSAEEIIEAAAAGQVAFGENRVQEAAAKSAQVRAHFPHAKLHLIGQLQLNKVKKALMLADCIESVDRMELIDELEKQAAKLDRRIDVLLEYRTGEASKAGFTTYDALESALAYIADGKAPHVQPTGFMTMAPHTADEGRIRTAFASLREAQEKLSAAFPQFSLTELSMGMSDDYKIAVQEGSTQVRIGTAIFGSRYAER